MIDEWNGPWPAPAKLNLMLHVLGRRADGYHDLQTVFQLIDLCDQISFRMRDDGVIRRVNDVAGVSGAEDLCVRAAQRLREVTGVGFGVDIRLQKRIPLQAGLGGGSSDAATVLTVLNVLWNTGLSERELMQLGLSLGADVPVFIAGRNAWAEGVGERLTPLDLPRRDYLVVQPDCAISTADIFAAADLTRSTAPLTIQRFLAGEGGNDCTPVVLRRYPQVSQAIDWLGEFGKPRLSGTGACVYLPCRLAEARSMLAVLPQRWRGWAVRGLSGSPLAERLGRHDPGA